MTNGKKTTSGVMAIAMTLFFILSGCHGEKQTPKKLEEDTTKAVDFQGNLILKDVTLEQADEKGQRLWKVKATQAIYSKDKQKAQVQNPVGDLYQDGKLVLQAKAEKGRIEENGRVVFLEGKILATDVRNGAVLRGEELEWHPKEDLLIVRKNVTGNHPQLQATAQEGRYFTRSQRMELFKQVVGMSKDPVLEIRTEHLTWQIPQQLVSGDRRVQIDRFKDKKLSERVEADRSQVNLKTKVTTLTENVLLNSVNPPVQISTSAAIWNLNAETVVTNKPIRIIHFKEKVLLTGNQGQINLRSQVAILTGGVSGIGSRNQAQLYANQLLWQISTQRIEATGNIIYKQTNPPFSLKGPVAVGKLQGQSIVVSGTGSNSGRVVTEFIP